MSTLAWPGETDQEIVARRVLVTGGATGIGAATARLLAGQGAHVAIVDVRGDPLAETVREINDAGGHAMGWTADVRDRYSIAAAVDEAAAAFGAPAGLDALVTSAGIQRYGDAVETDEATWDEVFAVNVKGAYLSVQAALPYLRAAPGSAIVVVSSVQALGPQRDVVAYAASKGALNAMVRAIAIDEAARGVRVNAVCPGSVDTPMLRASAALFTDGSTEAVDQLVKTWGTAHPLGRVAQPTEIAEVIAFLLSARASFITGENVLVDGGLRSSVAVTNPVAPGSDPA